MSGKRTRSTTRGRSPSPSPKAKVAKKETDSIKDVKIYPFDDNGLCALIVKGKRVVEVSGIGIDPKQSIDITFSSNVTSTSRFFNGDMTISIVGLENGEIWKWNPFFGNGDVLMGSSGSKACTSLVVYGHSELISSNADGTIKEWKLNSRTGTISMSSQKKLNNDFLKKFWN